MSAFQLTLAQRAMVWASIAALDGAIRSCGCGHAQLQALLEANRAALVALVDRDHEVPF